MFFRTAILSNIRLDQFFLPRPRLTVFHKKGVVTRTSMDQETEYRSKISGTAKRIENTFLPKLITWLKRCEILYVHNNTFARSVWSFFASATLGKLSQRRVWWAAFQCMRKRSTAQNVRHISKRRMWFPALQGMRRQKSAWKCQRQRTHIKRNVFETEHFAAAKRTFCTSVWCSPHGFIGVSLRRNTRKRGRPKNVRGFYFCETDHLAEAKRTLL